jgi:uracil-DNA glycosylase
MPTYHPAYVLRTYTTQVRGEVWSDLRAVLSRLGRSVAARRDADGT